MYPFSENLPLMGLQSNQTNKLIALVSVTIINFNPMSSICFMETISTELKSTLVFLIASGTIKLAGAINSFSEDKLK